jgi:hypothetical protein
MLKIKQTGTVLLVLLLSLPALAMPVVTAQLHCDNKNE